VGSACICLQETGEYSAEPGEKDISMVPMKTELVTCLDVALSRVCPHCCNEDMRHCAYILLVIPVQVLDGARTCSSASDACISRSLIISTTTEHPDILPFVLPRLNKILFA
jgi:hypothetical protein